MAPAVHCQLNLQVRQFVPMVMAPNLAYGRGKQEGGEECVSKHKISLRKGKMGEATQGGTAKPTSRGQNTNQKRERGEEDKI